MATQAVANRFAGSAYIPPVEYEYESWVKDGELIFNLDQATPWLIGDWLNFGEARYGEKYSQALPHDANYSYNTLVVMGMVARAFPPHRRRPLRENGFQISWSHYRIITPLAEGEQEQWLNRVEEEGWSRDQLANAYRLALKSGQQTPGDPAETGRPDPLRKILLSTLESLQLRAIELCQQGRGEWYEEITLEGDHPLTVRFEVKVKSQ